MNEHLIAQIIGWSVPVITLTAIIWMGVRIARRNQRFKQKLEYLDDGFLYHGPLGDTHIKWKEILTARVELHTPLRWKSMSGAPFYSLDIDTKKNSIFIPADDFEHSNFDEFINALENNVRTFNPGFQGIIGETDLIREEIPKPYTPSPEELEEERQMDDVIRRVEARVTALGRPVSKKERKKIVLEELGKQK